MNNRNVFIKKLIYRSKYTGTRETDILLGNFAENHLKYLDDENLLASDTGKIIDKIIAKIKEKEHNISPADLHQLIKNINIITESTNNYNIINDENIGKIIDLITSLKTNILDSDPVINTYLNNITILKQEWDNKLNSNSPPGTLPEDEQNYSGVLHYKTQYLEQAKLDRTLTYPSSPEPAAQQAFSVGSPVNLGPHGTITPRSSESPYRSSHNLNQHPSPNITLRNLVTNLKVILGIIPDQEKLILQKKLLINNIINDNIEQPNQILDFVQLYLLHTNSIKTTLVDLFDLQQVVLEQIFGSEILFHIMVVIVTTNLNSHIELIDTHMDQRETTNPSH